MLGIMDSDMQRFKIRLLAKSCSPFVNRDATANTRQTISSTILSPVHHSKSQMTKRLFLSLCTQNCAVGRSMGSLNVIRRVTVMHNIQTPNRTTKERQKEEVWSASSTALR